MLVGAIEFLSLMCEGREDRSLQSLLSHAVSAGDESTSVALRVLEKLRIVDQNALDRFTPLITEVSWP